ncbi:large ribosomal subunit protein uL10m isoform X2 [Hyperolius riggenbachi]|uniref:large ribosomal subunit protein uL10m isoform X2 n=1 Tax=Hyperolius riggenbachi TaxID=752182 RepID=UPI0035A365D2
MDRKSLRAAQCAFQQHGDEAWLPSVQWVRHGSKAVTRHKKAIHFERQKILALTEYIPPKPSSDTCRPPPPKSQNEKENLLEKFLCTQLEAVLQDSKMVAVIQRNAIREDDFVLLKHRLFKHDIHIKVFSHQIIRKVMDKSRLQALLPLFIGQTFLLVSSQTKVKEMLQALRSVPQIQLLGACIDDTLLSWQGVVNYSKLPNKETLQGQVVGTLSTLTSQTASLLTHHSARLCNMLEQHSKEEDKSA